MYLPSNTPILTKQRADAARHGAESDIRIDDMRRTSACGRARLFNTLVNPNQVADAIGMGTALDASKLQAQTNTSRAVGILGTGGQIDTMATAGPSVAEIIANAPEVVSLNRGGGCTQPTYQPVPLGPDPKPGMPARAPNIVQGVNGPMYYRGADATFAGNYPTRTAVSPGLSGFAPAWGDAGEVQGAQSGVGGWLMSNPWLALAIAGAGVYALSRRGR
jgi:hypothetical protein